MKLVTEKKITAYQVISHEPYIPETELYKVKGMPYTATFLTEKEDRLIRDEADRVSRAASSQ